MVDFSELRFFQQVIVHQRSRNTHCNPKWQHFLFNIPVHLAKKEIKHKTSYSLQQTRVVFKNINSRPFNSDFLKQESMVFSYGFNRFKKTLFVSQQISTKLPVLPRTLKKLRISLQDTLKCIAMEGDFIRENRFCPLAISELLMETIEYKS